MAFTKVQDFTAQQTSGTTSHPVTFGALTAGQLLVVCFHSGGSTSASLNAPAGDGWTKLSHVGIGGGNVNSVCLFYKIAGAGESTTKTFTSGSNVKSNLHCTVWEGVDAADPFDVEAANSFSTTTSATVASPPTVNAGGADRRGRLVIGIAGWNSNTISVSTMETGFTTLQDLGQTGARGRSAYAICAPISGTAAPWGCTLSSNNGGGVAMAVFKGSAGGGRMFGPSGATDGVDTYLDESNPTTNFGGSTAIVVGPSASKATTRRHGLLRFDVSDLPAGAVITSATLRLQITAASVEQDALQVGRLTQPDWVEAEATWNIRKTGSDWSEGGGAVDYAVDTGAGPNATGYFTTGSFAFLVQSALQERAGILDLRLFNDIMGNDGRNFTFAAADHPTLYYAPILQVAYTVPGRVASRRTMVGAGL